MVFPHEPFPAPVERGTAPEEKEDGKAVRGGNRQALRLPKAVDSELTPQH